MVNCKWEMGNCEHETGIVCHIWRGQMGERKNGKTWLLWLVIWCVAIASTGVLQRVAVAQSEQTPALFAQEVELIRLVNLERRKAGLLPLRWNRQLSEAARWFARDAVDGHAGDYCGHTDTLGRSPGQRMSAFGFPDVGVWGETVVCGSAVSPAKAVERWMNSSAHRAIMLDATFREIGIGYYHNAVTGKGYVVGKYAIDPQFGPMVVNDEAPLTTSPQVTLTIYDQGNSGGFVGFGPAVEMRIASEPTFASAQWQPFVGHSAWLLEGGTGWRTVHVQTRDTLSRTTQLSDAIYLGDALPAGELTLAGAATVTDTLLITGLLSSDQNQPVALSLGWIVDSADPAFVTVGAATTVVGGGMIGSSAIRLAGGAGNSRMVAGSIALPADRSLTAAFRLRLGQVQTASEVATLTVKVAGQTFGPVKLTTADFASSAGYQEFDLPFLFPINTPAPYVTVEIKSSGAAELFVDAVRFFSQPLPPTLPLRWPAPNGYHRSRGVWARVAGAASSTQRVFAPVIAPAPDPNWPVTSALTMSVYPPTLAFTVEVGSTSPLQSVLAIDCGNVSCGPVTTTAPAGILWLGATPAIAGAIVKVNPSGLSAGVHTATLLLSVQPASGQSSVQPQPISFPVTLVVKGPPSTGTPEQTPQPTAQSTPDLPSPTPQLTPQPGQTPVPQGALKLYVPLISGK